MKRRYIDGIDQIILDRVDAIDFISRRVELKKSGRNYKGLCPFHNEKTPSFFVSEDKQLFHCFGCGIGGNVINFVQEYENLDFIDAIEYIADDIGLDLGKYTNGETGFSKEYNEQKKILNINRTAAIYFYRNLLEDKNALDYLESRGIDKQIIEEFGLGFSSDSWDGLLNHMKSQNISEKWLKKAGLISESNGKTFDKFRKRIMFPIFNVKNNVLGFGGRVIDENDQPKYLNSPETKVFNKSNTLYGLKIAKKHVRNSNKMILVEGYMDVIMLNKFGVKNVVAALGTSFTKQHAVLLKKYVDEVVICFDSDEAGQKATIRAIKNLKGTVDKTKVIELKGGLDPDDYINKYGKDKFINRVENAKPVLTYLIDKAAREKNLQTEYGLSDFIKKAKSILKQVNDLSKAYFYVKKISEMADLPEEVIRDEIFGPNYKYVKSNIYRSKDNNERNTIQNDTFIKYDKLYEYEKKLLQIALNSREGFKKLLDGYSIEEFTNKNIINILNHLRLHYENNSEVQIENLIKDLDLEEIKLSKELLEEDNVFVNIRDDIKTYITKAKIQKIDNEISRLKKVRKNLSSGDDLNKNIIKETKLKNKKRKIYNSYKGGKSIEH